MSDLKLFEDIFELCSSKLNDRFNTFSQLKETSLSQAESETGLDNIDCRSEILLCGTDITLRIQLFYNSTQAAHYLKNIYSEVTKARIIDFFNEVTNLTGGKVKEIFFEQGIVVALSLPISVAAATNKVLNSSDALSKHKIYKAEYMGQSIYVAKISFEVHAVEKFFKFDKNLSKIGFQEGEVEFF